MEQNCRKGKAKMGGSQEYCATGARKMMCKWSGLMEETPGDGASKEMPGSPRSGRLQSSTVDRHSEVFKCLRVASRLGAQGHLESSLLVQLSRLCPAAEHLEGTSRSQDPGCGCKLSLPLSEGDAHTSCSLCAEVSNAWNRVSRDFRAEASLQGVGSVAPW